MALNKMVDLTDILFIQIKEVEDASEKELKTKIMKAQTIVKLSGEIMKRAKIEVDLIRKLDASKPLTDFFDTQHPSKLLGTK